MAKPKAEFQIVGEDATAAAFRSVVGNANKASAGIKSAMKFAFAGISVSAITGVAMRAIEMGDELNKAAIKAGINGRAMSELAHAAKMADVELAGLSTSLRFMQKNLSEASTGAKAQIETLNALGLKYRDLKGLAADRQFELIAQRISELKDPADRARAATEMFGKAGADLLPMFEQGAAGIRMAREEAEKLGKSFSDEQIKRLAEADDTIKRMKASWEGFATALTAKVAPALTKVFDRLSAAGEAVRKHGIFATWDQADEIAKDMSGGSRTGKLIRPGDAPKPSAAPGYAAAKAAEKTLSAWDKWLQDYESIIDEVETVNKRVTEDPLTEWDEWLQGYEDIVDEVETANKRIADDFVGMWDQMPDRAQEASMRAYDAFEGFFFDPMRDGIKGLAKNLLDSLRASISGSITDSLFGSKKSGGFGLGDAITGIGKSLFGFADGGSFKVGGSGGTDSQLVAFKASPNERVTVTKPGQGATPVVNVNIDARNSTQEAATIIRQTAPMIVQQAIQGAMAQWRDDMSRGAI